MNNKKNTAEIYDKIKKQIYSLEDRLYLIKEEVANYVVDFGKYRGKTLAEIAYKDISYYHWLRQNNSLPYTFNSHIDCYVRTKIKDHIRQKIAEERMRMREEQGYVGRFIL
nr:MAG TPA: exodeoxyribonuclease X [Caudoviricetes sp.]